MYAHYAAAAGDSAADAGRKAEAGKVIAAIRGLWPQYAEAFKAGGVSVELDALAQQHTKLLKQLSVINMGLGRAATDAATVKLDEDAATVKLDEDAAKWEANEDIGEFGDRVFAQSPVGERGFVLPLRDCGGQLRAVETWMFVMCPADDGMHFGVVMPRRLDDGRLVVWAPRNRITGDIRFVRADELYAVPGEARLQSLLGRGMMKRPLKFIHRD